MNLIVNGEQQQTKASNITALLQELSISFEGIAVAVNEEVISKMDWAKRSLSHNDAVLIITATQGG